MLKLKSFYFWYRLWVIFFISAWAKLLSFYDPNKKLKYRWHMPKKHSQELRPLVVLLHGCLQRAKDIAYISRFPEYVDQFNYYLLIPEQSIGANFINCWNWFNNQTTPDSETKKVVHLINEIKSKYPVSEIYLAGLSSGAGLAQSLILNHGELFSGALMHSGPFYLSAQNEYEARNVLKFGFNLSADRTFSLKKNFKNFIVHGEKDKIVNRDHFKITAQAFGVKPEDTFLVEGMGHAWSGGNPGPFSDPGKINITEQYLKAIFVK